MKNTLFINFGGIGDEILFLPTIRAYKENYPDSKITLALEPRSKCICDLTDLIDETISVDIKSSKKYFNLLNFIMLCRGKKFDEVISSGKSPFIAIILFLTGIKERVGYCSKTDFLLTKSVQLNENQYAGRMYHDLLKPLGITEYKNPQIKAEGDFEYSDFVAIHPGVSKMSILKNILKCPNPSFFQNLIKGLLNKNKKVLLLGSPDDKDIVEKILSDKEILNHPNFINYFNKTKNIMDMAKVMKNATCVICPDSAPMHCATALGVKTFALFCPTNEKKLVPENSNVEIIKNDIPCRPCLWHKRSENCDKSECLNLDYNMILDKIN